MYKPSSLRAALEVANPDLARDADRLKVFIEAGSIACTAAKSISFEYAYTLNVVVIDYTAHPDRLIVPALAWISTHQPELLQNRDLMREGFKFEAEILSNNAIDISLQLRLTERVRVAEQAGGGHAIEHLPEPPLDPYADVESWEYILQGGTIDWPPTADTQWPT